MFTSSSAKPAEWARDWLEGCRVLVTGGTGCIGGAIAECFQDAGASVHATGATEAECENARAADLSGSITYSVLDVRSNDAIRRLVGALYDIHVVVNCAGIIRRGQGREPEVFDAEIDINLNGTMRVFEASLEKLERIGGGIINNATMLNFVRG